jgi:hypothetical protein
VRVGDVELRAGIREIETNRAVNQIGTARVVLDESVITGACLDWRAEVQLSEKSTVSPIESLREWSIP